MRPWSTCRWCSTENVIDLLFVIEHSEHPVIRDRRVDGVVSGHSRCRGEHLFDFIAVVTLNRRNTARFPSSDNVHWTVVDVEDTETSDVRLWPARRRLYALWRLAAWLLPPSRPRQQTCVLWPSIQRIFHTISIFLSSIITPMSCLHNLVPSSRPYSVTSMLRSCGKYHPMSSICTRHRGSFMNYTVTH